ncbi:MAG: hypothetical protein HY902_16475 [Deltaproteobacteria bacterium]|nr:hypothetical protein [Deltaproteobacteria bacterium]
MHGQACRWSSAAAAGNAVRRAAALALAGVALAAAPACSFLEAAGEVTIGAEQKIPRVSTQIKWPSVDKVLGNALTTATGGAKAPAGLPGTLNAATLAHVQGLMTIDGECHRVVSIPQVDSKAKDSVLENLRFELTNCGDPTRCVERCNGFVGMKMEARIDFQMLDAAKVKKLKEFLSDQTSTAAILQIRAQFSQLDFFEEVLGAPAGQTKSIAPLFADSQMGLSSLAGDDDTVVVEQRYLPLISPKTPQRFELDPHSVFTERLKWSVLKASDAVWIQIFQKLWIPQKNLYGITLGGGGVNIELQPEFVINALEVVKGVL